MTFALPVDRNGKPIPLFPGERPRVVQRLATVTTSAVNSSALNVDTKMIRLFDDDGKECKLENREYRGCETIEEAQEVALNFLESRGIKEEIIIE